MSSAGWIFVGLLFISPFCEAVETKDEPSRTEGRQRRSIANLGLMILATTERDARDFLQYGNFCGVGGEGVPVDPIDECCQNHDLCYDLAQSGVCKRFGIFWLEYKWRVADDETAVCEDEKDQCKLTICMCDAILANCLKSNIDFYDTDNKKEITEEQMVAGYLALSSSGYGE